MYKLSNGSGSPSLIKQCANTLAWTIPMVFDQPEVYTNTHAMTQLMSSGIALPTSFRFCDPLVVHELRDIANQSEKSPT